ncbi:uncharacterized protein LY89DRAFT_736254 [Mollisia scopiformis]|uniref:RTA1-like protein n=1 Tax=Mollisia scopiformis TaxID=149040 RepID=A0A194X2Z7_MOLSC|nr:uncharacterized protein LY89DRAFT_736254 [Mollisia scopiformis]KUJ14207.1 hypothetical protein LY89DRAFT_736254 [Mollisia scopiformis]
MTTTCAATQPHNGKKSVWDFCPSKPAAYLFVVLFALTTLGHLVQTIYHRKPYCFVLVISGLLQVATFVFRLISIEHPSSSGAYAAYFVLMIAPLFTNAVVYMVMGRMTWNFIPDAKLYNVTAWRFGTLFVILDIFALFVQLSGASSAAGDNKTDAQILKGLHIYMGGVALQQIFIFIILFFAIKFHRLVLQQTRDGAEGMQKALMLLQILYAILALITVRIIFRLLEYANGLNSSIPQHEVWQYCFDSALMFLALVLFNIVHPGRIMSGKESNIPSRKERKLKGLCNKPGIGRSREDIVLQDT